MFLIELMEREETSKVAFTLMLQAYFTIIVEVAAIVVAEIVITE